MAAEEEVAAADVRAAVADDEDDEVFAMLEDSVEEEEEEERERQAAMEAGAGGEEGKEEVEGAQGQRQDGDADAGAWEGQDGEEGQSQQRAGGGDSVQVAVRIRPLLPSEADGCVCVDPVQEESQVVVGVPTVGAMAASTATQTFTFDRVYAMDTRQAAVYDDVYPLVRAAFEGFNATILAYGQTGSGKTYTMGSTSNIRLTKEEQGIIPRVIADVFSIIEQKTAESPLVAFKVKVQFLEIYGEAMRDLLDPSATKDVAIREGPNGQVYVSGAHEEVITSEEEMMMALERGTMWRTTGSTLMNAHSSRSHAIFTLILEQRIHGESRGTTSMHDGDAEVKKDGSEDEQDVSDGGGDNEKGGDGDGDTGSGLGEPEVRTCKFHFVDLAGSERAKRTGASGLRLKEGIDINKGLLVLGNVISALGDDKKRGKVHVPYRDSKLTRMLQDSLGGNSKTLMIACVSPSDANVHESLNALRYANRARNIQNKPVVNRDPNSALIAELRRQVQLLAGELLVLRQSGVPRGLNSEAPAASASTELLQELAVQNAAASRDAATGVISVANASSWSASARRDGQRLAGEQQMRALEDEVSMLRSRVAESDTEIQRLNAVVKQHRTDHSVLSDQLLNVTAERDYFKIMWEDASSTHATTDPNAASAAPAVATTTLPDSSMDSAAESPSNPTADVAEGGDDDAQILTGAAASVAPQPQSTAVLATVRKYLAEIEDLKAQLIHEKRQTESARREVAALRDSTLATSAVALEDEMANSIAKAIARAQKSLRREEEDLIRLSNHQVHVPGADATYALSEEESQASTFQHAGDGELTDSASPIAAVVAKVAEASPSGGGDTTIADAIAESIGDRGGPLSPPRVDKSLSSPGRRHGRKSKNSAAAAITEDMETEHRRFQRRQQVLSATVSDLSESIMVKEQLMRQLKQSQKQYDSMKVYYEKRLAEMNEEIQKSEADRSRLVHELSELEKRSEEEQKEKHERLTKRLRQKEFELRELRGRQGELQNLARVKSRSDAQIAQLTEDIATMKRSRVELQRRMQRERKQHMALLNHKVKEIEILKRERRKDRDRLRKLDREKQKVDKLAKRHMEEASAYRKRTQELIAARTGRVAGRAGVGPQRLTQEELAAKLKLQRQIRSLAARHAKIDQLVQEHERRLQLLKQKESLEMEKQQLTQTMDIRSVLEDREAEVGLEDASTGRAVPMDEEGEVDIRDIEQREHEEANRELEERIEMVTTQLELKNSRIQSMETQMGKEAMDAADDDQMLADIQRDMCGSLPHAHTVIRLLFDMLVDARRQNRLKKSTMSALKSEVAGLQDSLEETEQRIEAEQRRHNIELARVSHEYEVKLSGLLTHTNVGVLLQHPSFSGSGTRNDDGMVNTNGETTAAAAETSALPPPPPSSSEEETLGGRLPRVSLPATDGGEGGAGSGTDTNHVNPPQSAGGLAGSRGDQFRAVLAVANERNSFLQQQLTRQEHKVVQLEQRIAELESIRRQQRQDVMERDMQIRFYQKDIHHLMEAVDDARSRETPILETKGRSPDEPSTAGDGGDVGGGGDGEGAVESATGAVEGVTAAASPLSPGTGGDIARVELSHAEMHRKVADMVLRRRRGPLLLDPDEEDRLTEETYAAEGANRSTSTADGFAPTSPSGLGRHSGARHHVRWADDHGEDGSGAGTEIPLLSDDESDSDSIAARYDHITREIMMTGNILPAEAASPVLDRSTGRVVFVGAEHFGGNNSGAQAEPDREPEPTGQEQESKSIFDRLADPTSFTGTHRSRAQEQLMQQQQQNEQCQGGQSQFQQLSLPSQQQQQLQLGGRRRRGGRTPERARPVQQQQQQQQHQQAPSVPFLSEQAANSTSSAIAATSSCSNTGNNSINTGNSTGNSSGPGGSAPVTPVGSVNSHAANGSMVSPVLSPPFVPDSAGTDAMAITPLESPAGSWETPTNTSLRGVDISVYRVDITGSGSTAASGPGRSPHRGDSDAPAGNPRGSTSAAASSRVAECADGTTEDANDTSRGGTSGGLNRIVSGEHSSSDRGSMDDEDGSTDTTSRDARSPTNNDTGTGARSASVDEFSHGAGGRGGYRHGGSFDSSSSSGGGGATGGRDEDLSPARVNKVQYLKNRNVFDRLTRTMTHAMRARNVSGSGSTSGGGSGAGGPQSSSSTPVPSGPGTPSGTGGGAAGSASGEVAQSPARRSASRG